MKQLMNNGTRNDLSARGKSPEGMLGIYARGEGDEADSIARLKGRSILVESNVAVAQKRLNEFRKDEASLQFRDRRRAMVTRERRPSAGN